MDILRDLNQAVAVTVLDTLACSGRPLVQQAIHSASQRAVVVATTPHHAFKGTVASTVDVSLDPLGWNGTAASADGGAHRSLVENVRQACRRLEDAALWVVVEGCSDLVLRLGVQTVCDIVQQLRDIQKVKRVLLLIHRDLHADGAVAALEYVSDAVFNVRKERYAKGTLMAVVADQVGSTMQPQHHGYADITHRRPQGKVVRSLKRIVLPTEKNPHVLLQDVDDPKKSKAEAAPDPTANLTFKLNLTDEEKRAKEEVILPYTHSEDMKESILHKNGKGGGGHIYYEADDGDDFDEEDPDDDLNV